MGKKKLCFILAAVLAVSSMAVSASAVTVDNETSSASKGTFFFDSGDWNSDFINFYIWDSSTGEYATGNNGWVSENTWGSKKKLGGKAVEGKDGVFESYEIDFSGRENDAVYVIFHDPNSNAQTFDAIINSSVIGTTASKNGIIYENPADSDKTAEGVSFDGGSGIGVAKVITSTGKIQGDIISPTVDRADIVARYVLNCLNKPEADVTAQSVANAMAEFGTNADDVWEKYISYKYNLDYYGKYDEEAASKVIKSGLKPQLGGGLIGDVDGSGRIDSEDALSILRASVQLENFDENKTKLGDVDSDGKLTSADSLQVLRYSVHLSVNFPVGEQVN